MNRITSGQRWSPIRRRAAASVLALGLLASLAACSSGSDEGSSRAELDRDATLRYATYTSAPLFDPVKQTSPTADFAVMSLIYDGLVSYGKKDDKLEIVPSLAKSFEVAPDGLKITFKLQTGIKFQDGTAFNAAAVAANVNRAQTLPESTVKATYRIIKTVDTPDDSTVVFNLSEPSAGLLHDLSAVAGFMVSPAAFGSDPNKAPVGTGPYRMKSATNNLVTYERYDGYWAPDKKGFAKIIEMHIVTDDSARMNGFESGTYDIVRVQPADQSRAESLAKSGKGSTLDMASQAQRMLYLNTSRPGLNDPRVIEALDLALDRKALNAGAFANTCDASDQLFTPSVLGHVASGLDPVFDVNKAKQLIAQSGVTNLTVRLLSPNVSDVTAATQIVQSAWAAIGVKVEIIPYDSVQARGVYRSGQYDGLLASLPGAPDPTSILSQYLSNDTKGPIPPQLQTMAAAASKLSLSDPTREKAYQDIARFIHDNRIGGIPLCVLSDTALSRPKVENPESALALYIRQSSLAEVKVYK